MSKEKLIKQFKYSNETAGAGTEKARPFLKKKKELIILDRKEFEERFTREVVAENDYNLSARMHPTKEFVGLLSWDTIHWMVFCDDIRTINLD